MPRTPWTRADAKIEREFQMSLAGIGTRLAEVESLPAPEVHRVDVEALRVNLASLNERFTVLRDQLELFPSSSAAVDARLDSLDTKVKDQIHAIDVAIERTNRAERRIGATVARARKELEKRGFKDPGLEAEDRELRLLDGDAGNESGLLDVRDEVESVQSAPSSIAGVTLAELQRARGV